MGTGNMEARALIYAMIDRERDAQDRKWKRSGGNWPNDEPIKLAVLTEEVGEVAQAILKKDPYNMNGEILQVAAVAVAWLESEEMPFLRHCFGMNEEQPDPELKVLREVYAAAASLRAQVLRTEYDGAQWLYGPQEALGAIETLDKALDKYDLLERTVRG